MEHDPKDLRELLDPEHPEWCEVCGKSHPVVSMVLWCLDQRMKGLK